MFRPLFRTTRLNGYLARRLASVSSSSLRVFSFSKSPSAVRFLTLGTAATTAYCFYTDNLPNCSGTIGYLDELFEKRGVEGNLSKCLEGLKSIYKSTEPRERGEVCFRLARACYNLLSSNDPMDATVNGSKEKKKQLAHDALRYAQESLECAPEDFRSHYWCGIAIQAVGEYEGTKYTITHLMDIRKHFENAAKLNETDGTTQYCLGSWCYSLADLGYFSRKLAATIFGTPPESTFEEALTFFLRAEEVEPLFWNKNALMIAKTYEKLGNKEKAAEWAKTTSNRPCVNAEDDQVKQEALQILKKYT